MLWLSDKPGTQIKIKKIKIENKKIAHLIRIVGEGILLFALDHIIRQRGREIAINFERNLVEFSDEGVLEPVDKDLGYDHHRQVRGHLHQVLH